MIQATLSCTAHILSTPTHQLPSRRNAHPHLDHGVQPIEERVSVAPTGFLRDVSNGRHRDGSVLCDVIVDQSLRAAAVGGVPEAQVDPARVCDTPTSAHLSVASATLVIRPGHSENNGNSGASHAMT